MIWSLKNKLILISLLIFIISLFFGAFQVKDMGKITEYPSINVFLIGPIGFLGGGIFEFFVWTANIWLFIAIISLFKKKFLASVIMGIIALSVSGSFMLWKEILVSESGRTAKIYSWETGYFLWLISMICIVFSSVYLKIKNNLYMD
ncbi:hypothetical protein SAMN05880574_12325 [Chryseobacterium sp. RU37D]|uniref:hypothetical protein n=1 Tax=Chryseobacterium sp. RU37D TaxID=1907397 RepID=UPI00095445A8|nr:hypothetical protein [Chryseobacterium sp. RU37D]SIQ74231.1 hypothetical protein SAMN05880574_12325 [Chryseobacterium sp. RU37D]